MKQKILVWLKSFQENSWRLGEDILSTSFSYKDFTIIEELYLNKHYLLFTEENASRMIYDVSKRKYEKFIWQIGQGDSPIKMHHLKAPQF